MRVQSEAIINKKNIAVIGAGAAGMTAAIASAKAGADVVIFERNDRVGKKILMTGNGKCNLGNTRLTMDMYYTDSPAFVSDRLKDFGTNDTIKFFNALGLMIKEKNGGLYPVSEQASSVLDVLRFKLSELEIKVVNECMITEIRKHDKGGKNKFLLYADTKKMPEEYRSGFDSVIIACGGMAAPATGSDGNGYRLAHSFGHTLKQTVPALVQLRCEESFFKSIAGVRADARVEIYADTKKAACERGELQLTDYGISGIPVFQISRTAAYLLKSKKKLDVHIDFLPDYSDEDFKKVIDDRFDKCADKSVEEFFAGMLNKKLMQLFIRLSGLKPEERIQTGDKNNKNKEKIMNLFSLCRNFKVTVIGTNPFANAQVTAGGIPLSEITETFESRLCSGLYLAGEILDVDGKCGGYNLQWAWCSGYTAGISAAGGNLEIK